MILSIKKKLNVIIQQDYDRFAKNKMANEKKENLVKKKAANLVST